MAHPNARCSAINGNCNPGISNIFVCNVYLAILGSAKWCNIYGSGWVCCLSSPLPTWAAKPWPRVFVQPTSCHPSYHYVMYDGCSCLMIAIQLRITASLIHKRTIPGCPQQLNNWHCLSWDYYRSEPLKWYLFKDIRRLELSSPSGDIKLNF